MMAENFQRKFSEQGRKFPQKQVLVHHYNIGSGRFFYAQDAGSWQMKVYKDPLFKQSDSPGGDEPASWRFGVIDPSNINKTYHILPIIEIILVPGTSVFEGQPPKTRPFPIKTRVIWVPGRYCNYFCLFKVFFSFYHAKSPLNHH